MHSRFVKEKVQSHRKEGESIISLGRRFNIPKSTISLWVKNIEIPFELHKSLTHNSAVGREKGLRVIMEKRKIEQFKTETDAQNLLENFDFKDKNLTRLMAAILFWCEGNKRTLSDLTFINSDPALIKLFLHCLRTGFEIDENKLRCLVHIHNYHNDYEQRLFWSAVTGIPLNQFTKSYLKKNTEIRKRANYQGCIAISYFDARVARTLDAIYHAFANIEGP